MNPCFLLHFVHLSADELHSLAKAELHLTLVTIFRRFDLKLFETLFERDVEMKHEYLGAMSSTETKGIRVLLH